MKKRLSEEKLELGISYILIVGVIGSVVMEALGILSYYYSNRSLNILFEPEYTLKGTDFFSYAGTILSESSQRGWTPFQILSLGIILLMITPYIRSGFSNLLRTG